MATVRDFCVCGHTMGDHFHGPSNNDDMYCNECRCWDFRAAPPVGEPAPMPPVEVGDWVLVKFGHTAGEVISKVTDVVPAGVVTLRGYALFDEVLEIRKVSGVIWRRTDRKEPTL